MMVRMLFEVETTDPDPERIMRIGLRHMTHAFGKNLITAGILLDDVAPDVNTGVDFPH